MMGQLNHDQGEFFYSFRLDEVIASGSRRCLPTSNASCDLADLDCAARAANKMSSHWAPLHRTSAALQKLVARPPPAAALCPACRCRASAPFDQKPPPIDGRIIRARISARRKPLGRNRRLLQQNRQILLRKSLAILLNSDSVALMQFAVEAIDDGATQSRPGRYEIGISYFGRTYAEGKKINWKDRLKALWYIFKFRFR